MQNMGIWAELMESYAGKYVFRNNSIANLQYRPLYQPLSVPIGPYRTLSDPIGPYGTLSALIGAHEI